MNSHIDNNVQIGGQQTITGAKNFSGAITGTTATFSGAITGTTATFSGAITGTTAGNSTNDNTMASTKFTKNVCNTSGAGVVSFNKAANGYYKFNNGLIIQWGRVGSLGNENNGKSVTLPTAFSNANYAVVIQGEYSSRTINSETTLDSGTAETTTTFKFFSSYCSAVEWIAIGY